MRKLLWIVLAVMVVAVSAPNAHADSFTYTSSPYTACDGTYTCTGTAPALSITFDTSLTGSALDNLTDDIITGTISSFTFTDGALVTITNLNATHAFFEIDTNSTGQITEWVFDVADSQASGAATVAFACNDTFSDPTLVLACPAGQLSNPLTLAESASTSNAQGALVAAGDFENRGLASPLTPTSVVPEPASFVLLLIGIGLVFVLRKRNSGGRQLAA